jgi:hypothetical protein
MVGATGCSLIAAVTSGGGTLVVGLRVLAVVYQLAGG